MSSENLKTVADVFVALGGNSGVETITGSKQSTVAMWKAAGSFPSKKYLVMKAALEIRGKTAPPSLWGIEVPAEDHA